MTATGLRPATDCRFDMVAPGEVTLRLDPGERTIDTARSFDVWEGGLDRVGWGDSFASGFLYGLSSGTDPGWALECGVASTPGDTTMASLPEVIKAMQGPSARSDR